LLEKLAMSTLELKRKIVEQVERLDDVQLEAVYEIMLSFLHDQRTDAERIILTDEQKQMIKLGEADIRAGRYISQEELDKQDISWLNEP
jgi:hypothetical protein